MIRKRLRQLAWRLVSSLTDRPKQVVERRVVELRDAADMFAGRTALVVGCGRIGREICQKLLDAGAVVHVVDRRTNVAPAGAMGHVADMALVDDVDRVWSTLGQPFDMVFHTIWLEPEKGPFTESSDARWRSTFDANLLSSVYLTRLVGKALIKVGRAGSILFIGSVHHAITGGWPDYSASKAAQIAFMRELALEWAAYSIRLNAIAPGWVAEESERHADDFPHMPLGQCAIPPEYIAKAAIFLASDSSAFTTGHVMTVDGGLSLRSYRTAAPTSPDDPHVRTYDHP